MVNLSLSGIEGKLRSNAKNLGKLYGYLGPMAAAGPSDPIGSIIKEHEEALNAIMTGKFPTIDKVTQGLKSSWAMPVIKNAIMAYLAGTVAGGFIGSSNAKALSNFGSEALKYAVISSVIMTIDWNPHPPPGAARTEITNRTVYNQAVSAYNY